MILIRWFVAAPAGCSFAYRQPALLPFWGPGRRRCARGSPPWLQWPSPGGHGPNQAACRTAMAWRCAARLPASACRTAWAKSAARRRKAASRWTAIAMPCAGRASACRTAMGMWCARAWPRARWPSAPTASRRARKGACRAAPMRAWCRAGSAAQCGASPIWITPNEAGLASITLVATGYHFDLDQVPCPRQVSLPGTRTLQLPIGRRHEPLASLQAARPSYPTVTPHE